MAHARQTQLKTALENELPKISDEAIRQFVKDNYADAEAIEDSASDGLLEGGIKVEGRTMFARYVLYKNSRELDEGGPVFGALRRLYRVCEDAVEAVGRGQAAAHAGAIEVFRPDLVTDRLEEFYGLSTQYRDERIEALSDAMKRHLYPRDLPSDRMWGAGERRFRDRGHWKKIRFKTVQNAAEQKPLDDKVLNTTTGKWTLPEVDVPFPKTEEAVEEVCHLIERMMFLAKFVTSWESVHTFHTRFWRRVSRARASGPGYRGLTVSEIVYAYDQYQEYWEYMGKKIMDGKQKSNEPTTFTECVENCLPEDDFNLIRMAMHLDARPEAGGAAGGGVGRNRKRDRSSTPPKASKLEKGKGEKGQASGKGAEFWKDKHAKVVQELNATRTKLATQKWKPGGASRNTEAETHQRDPKKGGGGKRGSKPTRQPEDATQDAKEKCKFYAEGKCRFGGKCRYSHE